MEIESVRSERDDNMTTLPVVWHPQTLNVGLKATLAHVPNMLCL